MTETSTETLEQKVKRLERELEEANKRLMLLDALERGGVDNWEWYGEALSELPDDYWD